MGFLAVDPHPYNNSGLAAESAEVARQIDEHGRWFELNVTAFDRTAKRLRLGTVRTLSPDDAAVRKAADFLGIAPA